MRRSCMVAGLPYLSLVLLHIDLIPKNDEGEVLWVMGARLNEELVPPAVKRLETL